MKILLINWQDIKNPFGGGAEVHAHEIMKRLFKKGHEVFQFSCKFDGCLDYEEIDGIKIFRKGLRNTFNFIVPYWYFKLFKKMNFDIIIDDINKIPFYTPLYVKEPILAISHHFFGKSIFRETNLFFGLYVLIAEYIVNYVYKNTNFAVVSESTLQEFKERHFNTSQFKIVYNAFDKENFPMKLTQKYEIPTITYFGRLKKYKSIDHLFYSFSNLLKIYPNAKLEIIGKGDYKENLENLAKNLNISKNVIFHGFVDDNKKIELLSKSWIVVNTSMKEGWGITNIEANACGTPVVSANVPGLRDSVKDGFSGYLYEYGNIKDLENKISILISNNELRNRLSKNSIEWANNFSWDSSAQILENFCLEIINKS